MLNLAEIVVKNNVPDKRVVPKIEDRHCTRQRVKKNIKIRSTNSKIYLRQYYSLSFLCFDRRWRMLIRAKYLLVRAIS